MESIDSILSSGKALKLTELIMKNLKNITVILIAATFMKFAFYNLAAQERDAKMNINDHPVLSVETAEGFSNLALKCVQKEFPNKLDHVMNDASEVLSPKILHPAFYGCFDWHSSVHGHWMLVRILKMSPGIPNASEIRKALGENLSEENILTEVKYLDKPNRKSFERTYGWAWLLKLAEELKGWNDPDGKRWNENLKPLVDAMVAGYEDFLPKQTYPIRTGVHPNTAFALSFALDYARAVKDKGFEKLLIERSKTYYLNDCGAPAEWEPGGEDFFSPVLMEADLMRRVLSVDEFSVWLNNFLPRLKEGKPEKLFIPATVSDRSDPKLVHLDGLNLSRAWCMKGIVSVLASDNPAKSILNASAKLHADDALSHVASGNYEGEHWLASFAVYLLSSD